MHVRVCVCVSSGKLFEASLMVSLVLSRKHLSVHWMSSSRCSHNSPGCVCACLTVSIWECMSVCVCMSVFRLKEEGGGSCSN